MEANTSARIDDVQKDAEQIRVINWRSSAQYRSRWRRIVEEAVAHPGL